MSVEARQIVPVRQVGELKPYKTPDEHWQEVTEEMYGSSELPQTIHHEHDPEWGHRLWSVQSARNQYEMKAFGFWSFIYVLFFISQFSWLGVLTLAKWHRPVYVHRH